MLILVNEYCNTVGDSEVDIESKTRVEVLGLILGVASDKVSGPYVMSGTSCLLNFDHSLSENL